MNKVLTARAPADRRPIEQRASGRLLAAAAPVAALEPPEPTERRKRLLRAQEDLASTSRWTREVLGLAPAAVDAHPAFAPGALATLRNRLTEWRARGEEAITADAAAHAKSMEELEEGAAQLTKDLTRLRRCRTVHDVQAAKRAREAAYAGVHYQPVAPALTQVSVLHGEQALAEAAKGPAAGAFVQL